MHLGFLQELAEFRCCLQHRLSLHFREDQEQDNQPGTQGTCTWLPGMQRACCGLQSAPCFPVFSRANPSFPQFVLSLGWAADPGPRGLCPPADRHRQSTGSGPRACQGCQRPGQETSTTTQSKEQRGLRKLSKPWHMTKHEAKARADWQRTLAFS